MMSMNTTKPLGHSTGIPHIPDELVNDILHRLPVKPLLRFKCVCKSWCSLIDSTTFAKNHLERNNKRNPDSGLIFVALPKRNNFYVADVDSLNDSTVIKITKPLKTKLSGAQIVGSCNGLVCSVRNVNKILLWNPATRKCRKLPKTNLRLPFKSFWSSVVGSKYAVGFGYDQLNDDYKVVIISEGVCKGARLSVHSLKSNSWTRQRSLRYLICLFGPGMFVDGSLYWLSFYKDYNIIVAFDLADEKFTEVSLPGGVHLTTENVLFLLVFNRRLCLIDCYSESHTDIWLNSKCGVEDSWSKLFSVEKPAKIHWDPTSIFHYEIPLKVKDNKLTWFDSEKNGSESVTLYGLPAVVAPYFYTESLVHLSSDFEFDGKQLSKQSKQKKLKQQMKKKM